MLRDHSIDDSLALMSGAAAANGGQVPSRWWYLLAMAIALVGVAGMIAFMLPRLLGMADALIQVVVPGDVELSLDEPGTYTIFHERHSVVGDRLYVSENISGLRVLVTALSAGKEIPILPTAASQTYSIGGRSGTSAFAFEISEPGRYRLVAAYEDGSTQPKVVLAIGQGFLRDLLLTVLGSLAILFTCMAAAVFVAVMVSQKRKAARAATV